jgi:DNA modification methylase
MMDRLINRVVYGESLRLLSAMPTHSVDVVFADPMFGVCKTPTGKTTYDWGPDPCRGDPEQWWEGIPGVHVGHRRIYQECLRVLRPGGRLAWAMGTKFRAQFPRWFGGYRIWAISRIAFTSGRNLQPFGHIWVVQTAEQEPIRFPDADGYVEMRSNPKLLRLHPCPKAVSEMAFLVKHLTKPGDLVLDPFCGIGATLLACKQLGRRYIGCDLSRNYCRVALRRLRQCRRNKDADDLVGVVTARGTSDRFRAEDRATS